MKHLLNNISEEEKQSILEQHKGGMKVFNEKFNQLVNKKLGQVNLYEQSETTDDSSIFSTKKISELSDTDKDRLRNTRADVWDSLIGNTTFQGESFDKKFITDLLSSLNLFVVERAFEMTSLSMDDAIKRVLSQLPVYFKDDKYVQNISTLKNNLSKVQKMLKDTNGLRLAQRVALQNYNHNKRRTGIS